MSSDEVVIDVRHLSKRYEIYATPRDRLKQLVLPRIHRASTRLLSNFSRSKDAPSPQYFREFWALNDVSFEVRRGETFGIIGRNGSGKSTLLQMLAGVLAPTSGEANITGRVAALLELGSGFDPELTGRENVFLNGRILGLRQRDIEERYDRIVDFADIGEFVDEPVKTYSSGMFLRLAFAVQAHIDAAIVIIDEALAVGDIFFRQKCYARLEELKNSGAAILLVSHSMPDIEQHCERALLLDHGTGVFIGSSSEAAKHYYRLHQGGQQGRIGVGTEYADPQPVLVDGSGIQQPRANAFIDLDSKTQISVEGARCTGVALTDIDGNARSGFQQGDVAVFYTEYEISGFVGAPLCGVLLKNERGLIVHGKNAWQFNEDVPLCNGRVARIRCRHEISLDLAKGDYVFEVGLVMVEAGDWERRAFISHEEIAARYVVVCQIANAGTFSIGLKQANGISVLTHHGVADLRGSMRTTLVSASAER